MLVLPSAQRVISVLGRLGACWPKVLGTCTGCVGQADTRTRAYFWLGNCIGGRRRRDLADANPTGTSVPALGVGPGFASANTSLAPPKVPGPRGGQPLLQCTSSAAAAPKRPYEGGACFRKLEPDP